MFKQYSEQEQKQIEYQWWNEQRFTQDYKDDPFWKEEIDSTLKKLEIDLKQYVFKEETKVKKEVKPKTNLISYVWNRWIRRK